VGASEFFDYGYGKTADEAFRSCRDQAAYDYGHAGYTGTMAEKDEFVMIPVPARKNPIKYAEKLLADADSRIDDKWGPAGCIEIRVSPADRKKQKLERGVKKYLFFGWASS